MLVLCLGSWVLGLGSWVLGLGSWVLGLGSWVLGLGSWVLVLASCVLVLESWVLDLGSWVLGRGSWVLGLGSCSVVPLVCWSLVKYVYVCIRMILSLSIFPVFGKVQSVLDRGDSVVVRYCSSEQGEQELRVDRVCFCTGGLQKIRKIELPQEARFNGPVVYGCGGEPDAIDVTGKRVLVMGMGAFAVENARECLFRGAEEVIILARNRNMILPRLITYSALATIEDVLPMREIVRMNRSQRQGRRGGGNARGSSQQHYKSAGPTPEEMIVSMITLPFEMCGAEDSMPTELLEMKRTGSMKPMLDRESLGTIQTASDAFFIGHAVGKLRSVKGSVAEVLPNGVRTVNGESIACDVIIKNFGFEDPDGWLPGICGIGTVRSPMVISPRMWLFKCERAKPTRELFQEEGDFGSMLNLPAAAPFFAEIWTEMFDHYVNHETELEALLQPGKLPMVRLGTETYLDMCKGIWCMMQHSPQVAAKVNLARHRLGQNTKERYDVGEFIKQNRRDWRECCERIAGDAEAVPYIWDPLASVLIAMQEHKSVEDTSEGIQKSKL